MSFLMSFLMSFALSVLLYCTQPLSGVRGRPCRNRPAACAARGHTSEDGWDAGHSGERLRGIRQKGLTTSGPGVPKLDGVASEGTADGRAAWHHSADRHIDHGQDGWTQGASITHHSPLSAHRSPLTAHTPPPASRLPLLDPQHLPLTAYQMPLLTSLLPALPVNTHRPPATIHQQPRTSHMPSITHPIRPTIRHTPPAHHSSRASWTTWTR